jgi:hypothetical protein
VQTRRCTGFRRFSDCFHFRLALIFIAGCSKVLAGGVTLITHGFNGNVTDWIIPMTEKIPPYATFPGTNFSCYEISISQTSGVYYTTQTRLSGGPPLGTDSGEIIIKLDWSTLSGGSVPTTAIATQAVNALFSTTLIPEMGGRSLVELPLHLAGHSRGGSVVTEMARLLGAQGIWVDQVTTLDPHPVSLFGDPNVKNYANVLFADNYWQNLGDGLTVPNGQSVAGAYNRQLTNLNGGYTSSHSDVHLWYHGTIDWSTPYTDTGATNTATERATWWMPCEQAGTNAGFRFTLIGGGDRLNNTTLACTGGSIRDGFNTVWDIGAGVSSNRSSLPGNNGSWPNLLRLNVTGTNHLAPADAIPLGFYQQSGASTSAASVVRFFLDPDHNPYDTNQIFLSQITVAGTGTNSVSSNAVSSVNAPGTIASGTYWLYASISNSAHIRYLYAPQMLTIGSSISRLPPQLLSARLATNQFRFEVSGVVGQTIVVMYSTDMVHWSASQSNLMTNAIWGFADPWSPGTPVRFYRAQLSP